MKRFFVDKIQDVTYLEGEEFEHAKNVLRISVGTEVILLDNSGTEYTAVVAAVEKKRMVLNVVRSEVGTREANTQTCLLFGYLKNADKNEFIVQMRHCLPAVFALIDNHAIPVFKPQLLFQRRDYLEDVFDDFRPFFVHICKQREMRFRHT